MVVAVLPVLALAPSSAADEEPADTDGSGAVALLTPLTSFTQDTARRTTVEPSTYVGGRLDLAAARTALAPAAERTVRIALPAPDGTLAEFDVTEYAVMEPGLAAQHPELHAYAGRGVTDPRETIRLDVTPLGLHASVRRTGGVRAWYVDPAYYGRGVTAHISYLIDDLPERDLEIVEPEIKRAPGGASIATDASRTGLQRAGEVVTQRTYRMAWVTTPSYAEDFGTENVTAVKFIQLNRANHIYNDDMAISFVLVDGTDDLNLDTLEKATGDDGPCGANACFAESEITSCGGNGIDRNNFVAGQIVGADSYDIGHLGSGEGSGGVAYLGVVGGELKAGGCTALDEPRGDFYAVDFFAHEVGHQMGGNHTFNGTNGSCAGINRNGETSVEPGSGSSVMAYAGICFNDDLQPHTDPYFSQRTIDEFTAVSTAEPELLSEQQVVNLTGLSGTDSFNLTYPGAAPQLITNGANYTAAGLETAILALTGTVADVSGYDGASAPSADGFTVDFAGTADLDRLGVTPVSGDVAGFTGVTIEGGPTTNQGIATVSSNHRPVVDAGEDKDLPILTPFTLTGSATDADAGETEGLTYLWEQNDPGVNPLVGDLLASPVKLTGPLFRVFGTKAEVSDEDTLLYESPGENLADGDPSRTFPDIVQVLDGNTNAAGVCPVPTTDPTSPMEGDALDCYSEFLPDAAYALASGELNFRLTVRDGNDLAGGTGYDDVTLSLDPTAGPFTVDSRSTSGSPTEAGATETVEWTVAGTDAASLAPNVRILLSTDGGLTYPEVLAESTPNDGEQAVVLPDVNTEQARIRVEAVDNYFFGVNGADFTIVGTETPEPPTGKAPTTSVVSGPGINSFVLGQRAVYQLESDAEDAEFYCRLDGELVDCLDGRVVLTGLSGGTHLLIASAYTEEGGFDTTPAQRRFAVVANERTMIQRTDNWATGKAGWAYRTSYYRTAKKDQELRIRGREMRKFALLVRRGKGYGKVAVFVGRKKVGTVNLAASRTQNKVLVKVEAFRTPRTGTIRVRTLTGKKVIIDGIGIFNPDL
ncbi:MAG: hypothetical protein CMH83_03560 [Nocardioides sp.]|nr:hypothetical protein [Nocardioides sp.]